MAATRPVWRPPELAWGLLGLLAIGLIYKASPERLEGKWLVLTPAVVLVGVFALHRLWELPPAITVCVAIGLRVFSGAWAQIGIGGMPLDRLVIIVALLQVFLCSPGARGLPALRLRNVHLMMVATVLYLIVSAAFAGTLSSGESVQAILDEFGIAPYLAFLIAPAVFAGRRERDLLLGALVAVGLYLGVTAVFEALGPHSLVFPSYIAHVDAADPSGRVNGPFQSSVGEGCGTFICGVGAALAFFRWDSGWRRKLAAVAFALCCFACFATLERGVWIAAVAAAVVTALSSRSGRRWLVPGLVIAALAVGGLLTVSSTLSNKASTRVNDQRSIWDRQNQWSAGLRMIDAKPLFGFGLSRYRTDSAEYFRQSQDYPMTGHTASLVVGEPETIEPLHNLYLSYVVALGLVGALLWFGTLVWGVGGAIFATGPPELVPWRRGLLALAVFFLVVTFVNPKQPPFAAMMLWTWAGIAAGMPAAGALSRGGVRGSRSARRSDVASCAP